VTPETLKKYDFEIVYLPGARIYIEDRLGWQPDYKDPPQPCTVRTTPDNLGNIDPMAELMYAIVIHAAS
jgi:hypothetical protein